MTYQDLKQTLAISDQRVVIATGKLSQTVDDLLTQRLGGAVIIDAATVARDDEAMRTLVIGGQSTLALSGSDDPLPMTATFSLDAAGNVSALFRYDLPADGPNPRWTWARSFPSLPTMMNWNDTIGAPRKSPLTALAIASGACFIFASGPVMGFEFVGSDPKHTQKIDLASGINFAAYVWLKGLTGAFSRLAASDEPSAIYGTVRLPSTAQTLSLQADALPWSRDDAPGISLRAPLVDAFAPAKLLQDNADPTVASEGEFAIRDLAFRLYTPFDIPAVPDWTVRNPTFEPQIGYVGELNLPQAGIRTHVDAIMEWNGIEVGFYASFDGLSLGNLASLAAGAGGDDLLQSMPSEVQALASGLGKLELTHAAIVIRRDPFQENPLKALSVGMASFTIGMPDLQWTAWDAPSLVVNGVLATFLVQSPFDKANRQVRTSLRGLMSVESVPISITATKSFGTSARDASAPLSLPMRYDGGVPGRFSIVGRLEGAQTIPLGSLMAHYVPGVTPPSDLTVDALVFSVIPGVSYGASAAVAQQPHPWTLDIGPAKLAISDLMLNLTYPQGGPLSGGFSGNLAIGSIATVAFSYAIPGEFTVQSFLPKVKVSELVTTLVNDVSALVGAGRGFVWPSGFDITLDNSFVLIQRTSAGLNFSLATQVENVGLFAFQAKSLGPNQSGFALGYSLGGNKPSQIPGLGFLAALEKAVRLDEFTLVLSSLDDPGFQFPDLASFQTPMLPSVRYTLPGTGGVIPGLNLHARWSLGGDDPSARHQELLRTIFGTESTLDVVIQVGTDPSSDTRLYFAGTTTIQGHPVCFRFGFQYKDGTPGLFAEGQFTVTIAGTDQTFDAFLIVVDTGILFSASMTGSRSIDFHGLLQLGNLGFVLGADWEGIPSLGVAATVDVGDFESSVAVFFDSTDPKKSLVAGSVSEMHLRNIVEKIAQSKAPPELASVLDLVALEGTRTFKISDPSGTTARALDELDMAQVSAAFSQYGAVTVPGQASQVLLNRHTNPAVLGQPSTVWHLTDLSDHAKHYELTMSGTDISVSLQPQIYCAPAATNIGKLSYPQGFFLNGRLKFFFLRGQVTINVDAHKGIAVDGSADPIVVFHEKLFSLTSAKDVTAGPEISLATYAQPDVAKTAPEGEEWRGQPHFYVNGQVTILGMTRSFYGMASSQGVDFDLKGSLVPGFDVGLQGRIDTSKGLDMSAGYSVGVGTVDLGRLGKIDVNILAEGRMYVQANGQHIAAGLQGAFRFMDESFGYDVGFDVTTAQINDFAGMLGQAVKDKLVELFKDAKAWAEAVAKKMVALGEDVEKVLVEVFGKSVEEAKAIWNGALGVVSDCAMQVAALKL